MKILIDADCPRSIGTALKESGHKVTDIRDLKPNAADQEIYELIKKESFILVTRDTDFGNILRYSIYVTVHYEKILSIYKHPLLTHTTTDKPPNLCSF